MCFPLTKISAVLADTVRVNNSSTKSGYLGQVLRPHGYSLVELLLVIIVVGILAGIAVKSLRGVNDVARAEETKDELDRLAYAIAGNPDLVSAGVRTDYGYVGDVGALPANLDALVSNPGGYATWDGPYIKDELTTGGADIYFKSDAWGKAYIYTAGNTIASTGGAATMTRQIVYSTTDLLNNSVAVTITDVNGSPPGPVNKDSVRFVLTYPDGTGGTTTTSLNPAADGFIEVSSIPIGLHSLQVVYLPTSDTLRRKVNVDPGQDYYAEVHLFADVWAASGGGGGSGSSSEILRPMGVGSSSNLIVSDCTNNWECVDEVISDENATYVESAGSQTLNDTYETQNSAVGAGTIDSVVIFIRCKGGVVTKVWTALRTNGNLYESSDFTLAASYANHSTTYITNPDTSSPWTWTEIDAMEIGVTIYKPANCTQVWAEVHYTP